MKLKKPLFLAAVIAWFGLATLAWLRSGSPFWRSSPAWITLPALVLLAPFFALTLEHGNLTAQSLAGVFLVGTLPFALLAYFSLFSKSSNVRVVSAGVGVFVWIWVAILSFISFIMSGI